MCIRSVLSPLSLSMQGAWRYEPGWTQTPLRSQRSIWGREPDPFCVQDSTGSLVKPMFPNAYTETPKITREASCTEILLSKELKHTHTHTHTHTHPKFLTE